MATHNLLSLKLKLKTIFQTGGHLISFEKQIIHVTNTCSIDYMLLAMWYLHIKNIEFLKNLPNLQYSNILKQIIKLIDSKN